MRPSTQTAFARTVLAVLIGGGVFFLSNFPMVVLARVLTLDIQFTWLPSALLAGMVAGAVSRRWAFAVGALAGGQMLFISLVTMFALLLRGNTLPPFSVSRWGVLLLLPLIGGVGAWAGARWLPSLQLPGLQAQPQVWTAKRFVRYMAAAFIGVAILNAPSDYRPLLIVAVALVSFGYAGYLGFIKRARTPERRYGAVLMTALGCMGLLAAWQVWTTPLPPLTLTQSLGMLVAALVGLLLAWWLRRWIQAEK